MNSLRPPRYQVWRMCEVTWRQADREYISRFIKAAVISCGSRLASITDVAWPLDLRALIYLLPLPTGTSRGKTSQEQSDPFSCSVVGTGQTLAGGDKVQRHVERGPKGSVRCLLTHSWWHELFAICKLQEGQKLKGFSLLFATYVALFRGMLAGILPGGAHQERQAALFWLPTQNQHSWHALPHGSPALKGREEAGDLILWAPAFHPLEELDIFASCHGCRQAECIGSFRRCSPTPTKLIAKGHVYPAGRVGQTWTASSLVWALS